MRNCRRQGRFVSLPVQLGGASSLPNFSNRRGISGNLGRLPLLLLLHDQVYFFPSFPRSLSIRFSIKLAKVNRTDTRPVTRNFPGKERSDHNGGNRVGIFSTSSPSPRGAFLLSERRRYVIDRISRVSKIGDVIAAMAARKVSRRVARYFAARSWRETTDSFVS